MCVLDIADDSVMQHIVELVTELTVHAWTVIVAWP